MRLLDASLHPITLSIESETFVAQKLTLGDLEDISHALAQRERDSIEIPEDASPEEREKLQKSRNSVEPMTPGQLLGWLLTTARGQAMTLWTALRHRHPEMTIDRIVRLTWNDALVQTVYDLLDIKRAVPRGTAPEGEQSADPPQSGHDGEPISPSVPTSTPVCVTET